MILCLTSSLLCLFVSSIELRYLKCVFYCNLWFFKWIKRLPSLVVVLPKLHFIFYYCLTNPQTLYFYHSFNLSLTLSLEVSINTKIIYKKNIQCNIILNIASQLIHHKNKELKTEKKPWCISFRIQLLFYLSKFSRMY